jgi:hypothetical protein
MDEVTGYPGYKASFGKEQAMKIIQNEMVGDESPALD